MPRTAATLVLLSICVVAIEEEEDGDEKRGSRGGMPRMGGYSRGHATASRAAPSRITPSNMAKPGSQGSHVTPQAMAKAKEYQAAKHAAAGQAATATAAKAVPVVHGEPVGPAGGAAPTHPVPSSAAAHTSTPETAGQGVPVAHATPVGPAGGAASTHPLASAVAAHHPVAAQSTTTNVVNVNPAPVVVHSAPVVSGGGGGGFLGGFGGFPLGFVWGEMLGHSLGRGGYDDGHYGDVNVDVDVTVPPAETAPCGPEQECASTLAASEAASMRPGAPATVVVAASAFAALSALVVAARRHAQPTHAANGQAEMV